MGQATPVQRTAGEPHSHEQPLHVRDKVVTFRESLIGDALDSDKLEKVLNKHAEDGWQLKAITSADVKGRIGPGAVEGLLLTLERPRR
ncbi:DUF4177 domain-containing protein [Streptomyces sp. NPDC058251]|uniref:DUF4177 domain-containing protein n=1 Tax=Streptomyces sp. NPDC058251 TaxID=3346404 RepID=UPI0036EC843B